VPFGLVALEGGVSRNAIPREATAVVAVGHGALSSFERAAESALRTVARQYTDGGGLSLTCAPTEVAEAACIETTRRLLDLLTAVPTGVLAMSPSLVGVVETSTSLTTARAETGTLALGSMTRSSNAAALDDVLATMRALARLAGAEIESRRSYPPWEPDAESTLLATARSTHARLFGADPTLTVVHGGLECAVLGQRLPGVEMVSVGPEIVGPHAPGERVRISSTQRFYRLLGALLDDLSP
jgi:dipeptidase D